jgi:hypothetical protein
VEYDSTAGESACVGGKLITSSIPKTRRRPGGIPERTIQTGRKLGRVRHQHHLVRQPSANKSLLNSLDPSIHHIRRRNLPAVSLPTRGSYAIRPSLGIIKSNFRDPSDRSRIINRAILVEDPAMSVVRILAQTNIRRDEQCRQLFVQKFDSLNDGSLGIIGQCPDAVLGFDDRDAK